LANDSHAGPGSLPAPLSFSGFMAATWSLLRAPGARLLPIFAAGSLLWTLIIAASSLVGEPAAEVSIGSFVVGFFIPVTAIVISGSFVEGLAAIVMTDHLAGKDAHTGRALAGIRVQTKEVLASGLLAAMVALVAITLLFFLPYLFVGFFFGPPIVVQAIALEGSPLRAAVPRARELWKQNFLRVLGTVFFLATATGVTTFLLVAQVGSLVPDPAALRTVGEVALLFIANTLVLAVMSAIGLAGYLDLRARKEGYDLAALKRERSDSTPG
jgi:hypothetical protein